MKQSANSPYRLHRLLVDAIERECRVDQWRAGDIHLWPLASQDLFLDLFRQGGGDTAPSPPLFLQRVASSLAAPATNLWKSRHDLPNRVGSPHQADAVLLGDGVSLDLVNGSWRDRYGEPIIAELERQGRRCFVMESGNLERLPFARPTYAANQLAARSALFAAFTKTPRAELPDHSRVIRLIRDCGAHAPSLERDRLERRSARATAQAAAFERLLSKVRPTLAFVVTYYAGLGSALAAACRRLGILCVDLQHCPHDGVHRAYRWSRLPKGGYSTLPGLFWAWNDADAADIARWTAPIDRSWHGAIVGGHSQAMALQSSGDGDRLWQDALAAIGECPSFDREILVALQPIGGKRHVWDALADAILAAPPNWRWWIRRHPSSTTAQDAEHSALLALNSPKVVVGPEAQYPLPSLLPHMNALVSLASGAAGEAAMFGVPSFFLDEEARDTFPRMIASGSARIVGPEMLGGAIAGVQARISVPSSNAVPIDATLKEVFARAEAYRKLCLEEAGRITAPQSAERGD